jgi:hypothetical protein
MVRHGLVRKNHDLRNTIRANRKPKDTLPKHIWVCISFRELVGKENKQYVNTLLTYDHIKNNIL